MLEGEENKSMIEDNHINHARFMSSVFAEFQPEVLVETIIWVFRTYRSHGFNLDYWPFQLNQWIEIYKTNLSEKAKMRFILSIIGLLKTNHHFRN